MSQLHDDTIGAGSSGASASSTDKSNVPSSDVIAPNNETNAVASPLTRRARFKAGTYRVLSRGAYWSPVLVALVLFAQVSFRGLRPAMAEARRLSGAEATLAERHGRAAAENREVAEHLAARQDPIFRERQRRLRVIEPPATPSGAPSNAVSSNAASSNAASSNAVSSNAVSSKSVAQVAPTDDSK